MGVSAPKSGRHQRGRQHRSSAFVVFLLVLPRTAASYLAYLTAPLFLFEWRKISPLQVSMLAGVFGYSLVSVFLTEASGGSSLTSYAIELALIAPFILFAVGVPVISQRVVGVAVIRGLNVILALVSIAKMPFEGIPYLTVPPDYWNGLFGLGGAKILTIIGFYGILNELLSRERGFSVSRMALVASLLNFVVPSYLLGVIAGVIALSVTHVRKARVLVPLLIVVIPLTWWVASGRFDGIDTTAQALLGSSPKEFAYAASFRILPETAFFGAGPGQFASTPQTWVDPGLAGSFAQRIPDVPGLNLTARYRDVVAPYTAVGLESRWAFSSSANQPFAGWATLLGEWGMVALLFIGGAVVRMLRGAKQKALAASAIFFIIVNATDTWLDSPWMLACVLALLVASGGVSSDPLAQSSLSGRSKQERTA